MVVVRDVQLTVTINENSKRHKEKRLEFGFGGGVWRTSIMVLSMCSYGRPCLAIYSSIIG